MSSPFWMLDAVSVADHFGKNHPFVELFKKTGYIPEDLVSVFILDGEVIEPSKYGREELPKEMLARGEWLPEKELLQYYYGLTPEEVDRLEYSI